MSEKPDLPPRWVLATIEQILDRLHDGRLIHQGWSPQCEKHPSTSDANWGVLKTTSIQPGAFWSQANKELPTHLSARPQIEVHAGDLLLTCAGPRSRCGIACLVQSTRPRLMLSGKMYRFRVPSEHFEPKYIEYFLQSAQAQTSIDAMKTGGNDSGLNLTHDRFRTLQLPLAPKNEQNRIASKIDELFSSIDEGERALERVRKLVERYRQSVLKAAVTGELTREWREQHAGELESGEALLTRILEARRQAWEHSEEKESGSRLRRTPGRRYKEPCLADPTDLGFLPNGWTWATLDQLSCEGPTNGYSPSSEASSKGTLTLKLTATTSGKLRLDNNAVKRVDESIPEDSNLWLRDGDLLIQRANSYEHVGATAIFAGPEHTYIYPDLMMRIRLANPKQQLWVWRLLNSRDVRRYFQENATGTAGSMPKIGGQTVRKLALPMPPEEELSQLLSGLEQRLSECDQLLHEIQAFVRRISSLRQSILSRAFSGQLVPQDPTDEPASVLLERIAAERAAAPKRVATKNTRTKKTKAEPKA